MKQIDFPAIIAQAWAAFDPQRPLLSITDISAKVSTNLVYKAQKNAREFVIAKLSYFGRFDHFREDHAIINELAQLLPPPFEALLASSLTKYGELFTYRHQEGGMDIWVVFYHPVPIRERLPRRLNGGQITNLGREMARFHLACENVKEFLPSSSKTMRSDVEDLLKYLTTDRGQFQYRGYLGLLQDHCEQLLEALDRPENKALSRIPVFVDWNSGNFSLTAEGQLFSRWDYDWFRVSSRVMDFYFMSRVVSSVGDKTVFSYLLDPLMEDRFLSFLRAYHQEFPLTETEVLFIKEAYRFFILHYVINFGQHFFHDMYSIRLQQEACDIHLPELERKFSAQRLLQVIS
jgi:Ser/Thr protein kinase RdoA (MazF antagonist)